MKNIIIIAVILFTNITFAQIKNTKESMYYYNGKTISLHVNNNRFTLYFDLSKISISQIKQNFKIGRVIQLAQEEVSNTYACEVIIGNSDYDSTVKQLKQEAFIKDVEPVIGDTLSTLVSNLFYVEIESKNQRSLLDDVAEKTNSYVLGSVPFNENWIVLQVDKNSVGNSIEVANIFWETNLFKNIDPGFILDITPNFDTCVTDSKFSIQWGMQDINICKAWSLTTGNPNISVAVIDQGIEENHKEFENINITHSYDAMVNSDSVTIYDKHGCHVGGIIFANHNNYDIAGVSPNTSMINISHGMGISNSISVELATAINYAVSKGADIINNSWGDQ